MKVPDYYETLGVPRGAKPEDIKRAYRRLARKHHPDTQPPAERAKAETKIKEINEAYEVLRDPEKRARYDALGANWRAGEDFRPPNGAGRGGFAGGQVPGDDFGDLGAFSDFFRTVFGDTGGVATGRARAGRARARMQARGSDVEAELALRIEELFEGGKRRLSIGPDRTLDVEIPKGARDGTVLRLGGQGEPGLGGAPAGDLYLHVRLAPDAHLRVAGDDLELELALWPWQAVLGATIQLAIPGGAVNLKVPPLTVNGRRLRLKGRGLPRADGSQSDLYAIARIAVPSAPTPAELEAYEALRKASPEPPERAAS